MQKSKNIFSTLCLFIILTICFGCGSLSKSAINGDLDGVKSRIQDGEKVNQIDKWGWTPLLWATFYDYNQVAEYLLMQGANPNVESTTAQGLFPAGITPVHLASYYAYTNMLKLLLRHGADPNISLKEIQVQQTVLGEANTPLHLAAYYGHVDIVRLLLQYGADKNIKNKSGKTARNLAEKSLAEVDVTEKNNFVQTIDLLDKGITKENTIEKQ